MSGRPGRSGRRALPVADAVLRGVYRPDRHGPLTTATAPMATTTDEISRKTAARIGSNLGPSGKRLVRNMIRDHENWNAVDLETLRCAARSLDRIETLDTAIGAEVIIVGERGGTRVNALVAEQRSETRQFLQLTKQLGLEGT